MFSSGIPFLYITADLAITVRKFNTDVNFLSDYEIIYQ